MSDDAFFNGLSPDMPDADRRFFLGAGIAGLVGAGGLGAGLSAAQRAPGPGSWNQGAEISEWRGVIARDPFPMLRTRDMDGAPRTALLGTNGKCGVRDRLAGYEGRFVVIRGSLISRGRHAMIAVADGPDWIAADDPTSSDPSLAFGDWTDLGETELRGEILDTKCWFGAMRPGEGKPHKACATLCIRGGMPPGFYVTDVARQSRLMLLVDEAGAAHGPDLLPYVADPVSLSGRIAAYADLTYVQIRLSDVVRLV